MDSSTTLMPTLVQVGKLYSGAKTLYAWPMTRGQYNEYREWDMPQGENKADAGYLVEYVDGGEANDFRHKGYISWSPAGVFERTYQRLSVGSGTAQGVEMAACDQDPAIDAQYRGEAATLGAYSPSEYDKRQAAMHLAINSAGGVKGITADELIDRANRFYAFSNGNTARPETEVTARGTTSGDMRQRLADRITPAAEA